MSESDASILWGHASRTPGSTMAANLLGRAIAGEPGAMEELILAFGRTLFRSILRRHVRRALPKDVRYEHAKEIYQQTMLDIIAGLPRFSSDPGKRPFLKWASRIVANNAADFYRKLGAQAVQLVDEELILSDESAGETGTYPGRLLDPIRGLSDGEADALRGVREAVRGRMSPIPWEAGARAVLGESPERIARDLRGRADATTLNWVAKNKKRVLQHNKRWLESQNPIPPPEPGEDSRDVSPRRGKERADG